AARCGLSAEAVEVYHCTFYEVRPHLHADFYVFGVLIGPKAYGGLAIKDHEQLLKLFGYGLGGPRRDGVVDFLTNPPTMPDRLDDLDLPTLKRFCSRLRIKVMVLLLTTPASAGRPETWQSLAEQFAATRNSSMGGEEAVLASTHGPLDVLTGLSI